ncbi:hypothetical protein ACW73L_19595 [Methylolobus aquaticus]
MRRLLFICTVIAASLLVAASARSRMTSVADDPDNYCHDPAIAEDWRRMLSETPNDPIVIKLYGLREGLCSLVSDGRVSLEQAPEIWERECAESVVQRFGEDARRQGGRHL